MLFDLLKNIFGKRKRKPGSQAESNLRAGNEKLRAAQLVRFNMGSGHNPVEGYINVDASPVCNPDLVVDLENLPWPFETSIADEVAFNHSLEHMGQTSKTFLGIMQELYRISKPGAQIFIRVPHPKHRNFINDPTHVRVITEGVLSLFDKELNDQWQQAKAANSPLAHYLGVNFKTVIAEIKLAEPYAGMRERNEINDEDVERMLRELNNIAEEYYFKLIVIKP